MFRLRKDEGCPRRLCVWGGGGGGDVSSCNDPDRLSLDIISTGRLLIELKLRAHWLRAGAAACCLLPAMLLPLFFFFFSISLRSLWACGRSLHHIRVSEYHVQPHNPSPKLLKGAEKNLLCVARAGGRTGNGCDPFILLWTSSKLFISPPSTTSPLNYLLRQFKRTSETRREKLKECS